jgi:hypothetical protein
VKTRFPSRRPSDEPTRARADRSLAATPDVHPALFGDHAVDDPRDVAAGVVALEGVAGGSLLPARPADRRDFVVGLAVLLGYLHDGGMHDPTGSLRGPPGGVLAVPA